MGTLDQTGVTAAQSGGDLGVALCQPFDMGLIQHGARHGHPWAWCHGRTGLPLLCPVKYAGFGYMGGVVVWVGHGIEHVGIRAGRTFIVALQGQGARIPLGIAGKWVQQQFGRVEALAHARVVGPVGTQAIELPGPQAWYKTVPDAVAMGGRGMRAVSCVPDGSNRHTSTRCACAEYTAKFKPWLPLTSIQVAPISSLPGLAGNGGKGGRGGHGLCAGVSQSAPSGGRLSTTEWA